MMAFLALSITIFLYLLFYSFLYLAPDNTRAQFLYKWSSLGWLPIPFAALFFLLSLLDGAREKTQTIKFWLNGLLLLPIYYFIIKGDFLVTGFVRKKGLWIEEHHASWVLIIYYILVIAYYILLGIKRVINEKRFLHSRNSGDLLNFLINPIKITSLVIIIATILLPRMLKFPLPGLTHFIIIGFYIYMVILVIYSKVDNLSSNSIIKMVFDDSPVVIYFLGSSGRVLKVIYQSADFLYWSDKDLLGSPIQDFINISMGKSFSLQGFLRHEHHHEDLEMIDKSGAAISVSVTVKKHYSSFGDLRGLLFLARDNRQLKHLKEDLKRLSGSNVELRDLSIRDPLTGIFNRAKFLSALDREEFPVRRYGNDLSMIMLDIDHFKRVNDTYGHDVGDKVLCAVVKSVAHSLRDTDLFSRWGGEEFIILSRNTNLEQANLLAERLRQQLELVRLDKVGQITASFGVSQLKRDESREECLKRLDTNLYRAKETGRNRVVSDPPVSFTEG